MVTQPSAFVGLMRRYCLDYTNRHDISQVSSIMVDDYTLTMGQHRLVGRDTAYVPAASAQFRQFPGLGLTVHEVFTNGERLAMRFSEHGRSKKHFDRAASWSGLGLYCWDGSRLTHNAVEQDYYGRKVQLDGGATRAIEAPAVAPWDVVDTPANAAAESVVREFVLSGKLLEVVTFDDGWSHVSAQPKFDNPRYEIDDLFSAGNDVAFRLVIHGTYSGGLPELDDRIGSDTVHYAVGTVRVEAGLVSTGRVITDRLGLVRRMNARSRD